MPKQKRRSWMPKAGYYKVVGGERIFIVTGENHNAKAYKESINIREDG